MKAILISILSSTIVLTVCLFHDSTIRAIMKKSPGIAISGELAYNGKRIVNMYQTEDDPL